MYEEYEKAENNLTIDSNQRLQREVTQLKFEKNQLELLSLITDQITFHPV
jgi:hypothetical protein